MTMGELAKATTTWRQAHFGAVMLGSLQLSCGSSDKNKIEERTKCPSQRSDPVVVQKFWLDDVKGPVCTTQKVTVLLFSTINVWANTSVRGHCMWVHVIMELMLCPQLPAAVVPTATYGELHPGSFKGTSLPAQLECLCCGNTQKSCGWTGCPFQPNTNGGLPNQDCQRDKQTSIKRMGLGGSRPPRSHRDGLSQNRNRIGSCCSNGSTYLHTVTWIWAKLLWSSMKYNYTDQMPFKEHYQHIPPHM